MKRYKDLIPSQQDNAYNLFFRDIIRGIRQCSITFGPKIESLVETCKLMAETNKHKDLAEYLLECPEIAAEIEILVSKQVQAAWYSEPEDVVICELEY